MFLRTCKSPALLTLLAAVGAGVHARPVRADGPRDYAGATELDPDLTPKSDTEEVPPPPVFEPEATEEAPCADDDRKGAAI